MRRKYAELVRRLHEAGVEYVIVGNIAAAVYGSRTAVAKLEILTPFTTESMSRLLNALGGTHPRDAMRPDHPAISSDPELLARCRNLYLLTDLGRIDVFSELPGLGGYTEAAATARQTNVHEVPCKLLGLDAVIASAESRRRAYPLIDVDHLKSLRDS